MLTPAEFTGSHLPPEPTKEETRESPGGSPEDIVGRDLVLSAGGYCAGPAPTRGPGAWVLAILFYVLV